MLTELLSDSIRTYRSIRVVLRGLGGVLVPSVPTRGRHPLVPAPSARNIQLIELSARSTTQYKTDP